MEEAKKEAERIRRQAEVDAKTIVGESEIARVARDKAREMVTQANDRSKAIINVANEYTDDALRRTEEAVAEGGDIGAQVLPVAEHFPNHGGADVPVFGPGGQEDGVQAGAEVPVDLGQLELPVEIRDAARALHQGEGPLFPGEVRQEAGAGRPPADQRRKGMMVLWQTTFFI